MLADRNSQLAYCFQNHALDGSGKGRHGTVFGSGVYAPGITGRRSLYFDGTGDYVTTPSFGLPATHTVVVFAADVRCHIQAAMQQTFIGNATSSATIGYLLARRYTSNSYNLWWGYADGDAARNAIATDYFVAPYEDAWLSLGVVCDYAGKFIYFYRAGIPFGSPVAMSGTPVFPSAVRPKYIGGYNSTTYLLTDGYLANVYLATLATCPPVPVLTANAQRPMRSQHPIW